jgi:predicted alpha/beta superfamily hydrolase
MSFKKYLLVVAFFSLTRSGLTYGQDINIKIGFRDSIKSQILHETRKILIHLPDGYDTSKQSYTVLYRLDGSPTALFGTVAVANRMADIQKIIIVAIENVNRDRDMMPVKSNYYSGTVGGEKFLSFIEKEVIPLIENKYRTNHKRILYGQSLSGLFTLYALLTKPKLFDAYLGCSAGWFVDCNDYFMEISRKAFTDADQFTDKKIFMANSLIDKYDADQKLHQQMLIFSDLLKTKLKDKVKYKYETYDNYGHVPYPSFYDGLKYILELQVKN